MEFFKLLNISLSLDAKLLNIDTPVSLNKKISFILKKYGLITKHSIVKFRLGNDCLNLWNDRIYYNNLFGIASYQGCLTRHQMMINLAGIKKVTTFLDIGANVGFFSKLIRLNFPEAKIFAVEPIHPIFQCLKKNFKNDPKVYLFNYAISDKEGKIRMNFNDQDAETSHVSPKGKVKTKTKTLDSFIRENEIRRIDILKIDTESHEAHVLRGGSEALAITKYLFLEVSIKENNNYTISSLLNLLTSSKYDYQLVGLRNFSGKGEGAVDYLDLFLVNRMLDG